MSDGTYIHTPAFSPPLVPTIPSVVDSSVPPKASTILSDPQPADHQTHSENVPLVPSVSRHPMITRSKDGTRKPKVYHTTVRHPLPNALLHEHHIEPTSFSTAVQNDRWRAAVADEYSALIKNGTWILVSHTSYMHVIDSKWVYKIKYKHDGSVDRFKARLVAQGTSNKLGLTSLRCSAQ